MASPSTHHGARLVQRRHIPEMAEYAEISKALAAQSLDDTARFFAGNKGATQEECDTFAARLLGLPVRPTFVQGMASYTVVATGGGVVQFRSADNPLDLRKVSLAEETYGRFVPKHELCGGLNGLAAYRMDFVDGVSAFLAMNSFRAAGDRLLRVALKDFVR